MRTAVPGTRSRSTSVASSPSMSGIRRSMITTSGRRRSVNATADRPSAASPITRMRGERERASRRPSRTTSWSSAMRQVISSGTNGSYEAPPLAPPRPLDGECELFLHLSDRPGPARAPLVHVGHRARRRADVLADGAGDARRQVRPAREEPLVALDLFWPVACQVLEEVLADSGLEVEDVRPDGPRAGSLRCPHGLLELLRIVREPGEDRGHADRHVDSGFSK